MDDRMERLESAIYALDDAIDAISDLGTDYGGDVECLREIMQNYKSARDKIKAEMAARDAADTAALEREYYRGLL